MPGPQFIIEANYRDLDRAQALIDAYPKQVPFALAVGLTATARRVQKAIENEVVARFDRPTPYIRRSIRTRPATKSNLKAEVLFKDDRYGGSPATRFIAPHVRGGYRSRKKFEGELQRMGLLPSGHYAVPANALRLDQYGNVRRGTINRIMAQLRGEDSKKRFFSATIKGTTGVWERYGRGRRNIRPVLLLVPERTYDDVLKFYDIGKDVVYEYATDDFIEALQRAVATAK